MASTQSTVTLQQILDIQQAFGLIQPVLNVGGSSNQPFLTACNDVMNAICAVDFPHKWNEIVLPTFYTNSSQQDYAVVYPDGSTVTTLSWLARGIAVDINSTSGAPLPYRDVEVGRQLPQATGTWYNLGNQQDQFTINWFPNRTLYYGVWGDSSLGNSGTLGNNPVAGSVYQNPIGAASLPANPITQIRDANGNLLLVTTYGTEGSAAPLAAANAPAGTTASGAGATTVWTVVDPNGQGFRILPVPSQSGTVWQFNLVGQNKPVRFTNLGQTLDPLPDEFEPHFRAGVTAQLFRYSAEKAIQGRFTTEWKLWLNSLNELREKQDREQEENSFTLERGVMSGGSARRQWRGPAWPFNY